MYNPYYQNSWALIIGINDYRKVSPLSYAKNDAKSIFEIIHSKFDFPKQNITLLFDDKATKPSIFNSFLNYAQNGVGDDDRILIFFAGHGYTHQSKRGPVGYLVPVDGTPEDLSSLIRWDDLTRNADLIPAKHILFIMDACYSGLALTRSPGPGSMRFLKNMLQRYARQVITAGKADEVVADAGGPIPEHSIFTGHLLQGLEGNAATKDGIISAHGVMAYLYEKVSKDNFSQQTPHFGFVDGDGDFIFKAPILDKLLSNTEEDKDVLIEVPITDLSDSWNEPQRRFVDKIKEFIPDPKFRIKLDDLVTHEIKKLLQNTSEELFPVNVSNTSIDEFSNRLSMYESISRNIMTIGILLSYWGTSDHLPVLEKIIARITDDKEARGGKVILLALRYYPSIFFLYSSGISAIAAGNYETLFALLNTSIPKNYSGERYEKNIKIVVNQLLDLERTDVFKSLPGYENFYVPKNEYIFKALQPLIDDLLFLGKSYEEMFDRFEIFLALAYADLYSDDRDVWGPPGRFAYKYRRIRNESNPFFDVISDANNQGDEWKPLKAGFFGGSLDRFIEISAKYQNLLSRHGR